MKLFLNKYDYTTIPNWHDKFPNNVINFKKIYHCKKYNGWNKMFDILFKDPRIEEIKNTLEKCIERKDSIFPFPDLLFNAFYLTDITNLKVVFIGQDPYYTADINNNIVIPQAMGLSFSVPFGVDIPSSLKNIYSNLKKFNVINNIPSHGNLEFWAVQGCLMLNTSLTVLEGDKNKNCHKKIWKWFTDFIIKYISDNCNGVVFVLWGSCALEKAKLIDLNKHDAIVSSHPSGLSCSKKLGTYPSFNEFNHFNIINEKLKYLSKKPIFWG